MKTTLVAIGACLMAWSASPSEVRLTNLARSSRTVVTASSVSGGRPQDAPFYGVTNLFDGGVHIVNGINYTTWMSQLNDIPWVLIELPGTATVHKILLEFGSRGTTTCACECQEKERCPGRGCDPRILNMRPQEFAIDLHIEEGDDEEVVKYPSQNVVGFRQIYEFHPAVTKVKGVRVVFRGSTTAEVAEIEVLGVPDEPTLFPAGSPRTRAPE